MIDTPKVLSSDIIPDELVPSCVKMALIQEISDISNNAYKVERELLTSEIEDNIILSSGIIEKKKNSKDIINTATTEVHLIILAGGRKAIFKPNLEGRLLSNSKHELAAYKLDQLLELDLVPVTVERVIDGKTGSLQQFIDSTQTASKRYHSHFAEIEKKKKQPKSQNLKFFDFLTNNTDRHSDNYLITKTDHEIAIDHGGAFGLSESFFSYVGPPEMMLGIDTFARSLGDIRPEIDVLTKLRQLKDSTIRQQLEPYLTNAELNALLKRKADILQRLK